MAIVRDDIDPATLTAISDPSGFYPIVMFFVDWPDAPVYAHTNRGVVAWAGQSWNGVGNVANIQLPGDSQGMAAQEASIGIRGFGDELDEYLSSDVRDRAAEIYFGAVTERDGATLIGEPFSIFTATINGLEDLTEAVETGRTRGLQVPLSSLPSQRSNASVYHSFQDQSRRYPGDTAGRLLLNAERNYKGLRWPQ